MVIENREATMAMPVDNTGVAVAAEAATLLPALPRVEPSSSMSESSSRSRTRGRSDSQSPRTTAKARARGKPPRRSGGSLAIPTARPQPETSQPPRLTGGRLRKAHGCPCGLIKPMCLMSVLGLVLLEAHPTPPWWRLRSSRTQCQTTLLCS